MAQHRPLVRTNGAPTALPGGDSLPVAIVGDQVAVANLTAPGTAGTAAATVDVAGVLVFSQTTANIVATVATPTVPGTHRSMRLENNGTADLTITAAAAGSDTFVLSPGKVREYSWNGTHWRTGDLTDRETAALGGIMGWRNSGTTTVPLASRNAAFGGPLPPPEIIEIPANTLRAGSVIVVEAGFYHQGGAGPWIPTPCFGDTNNMSSVALTDISLPNYSTYTHYRTRIVVGSATSFSYYSQHNSTNIGVGQSCGESSTKFDITKPSYVFFGSQLQSAGDDCRLVSYHVVVYPPDVSYATKRVTLTSGAVLPAAPGFVAANTEDWPPSTNPVVTGPAPTYLFGGTATIDTRPLHWNRQHTGVGVFDWTNTDAYVAATPAARTFVWIGNPHHLAQGYVDGAGGDTGDAAFTGAYGYRGEMSFPTDMAQVDLYWDTFMARYNPVGPVPQFPVIQLGNEIDATTGRALLSFWWGTNVQAVTLFARAYNRIKLRNPAVIVLCPGIGGGNTHKPYLDAVDPITGLSGAQACDGIATHPYTSVPHQAYGSYDIRDVQVTGIRAVQADFAARGRPNLPVYATEWWLSPLANAAETQAFALQTPAYRQAYITRTIICARLQGYQQMALFSHGNEYLAPLQPFLNDAALIAGITAAHNALATLPIASGGYIPATKQVWVKYVNGTELVV